MGADLRNNLETRINNKKSIMARYTDSKCKLCRREQTKLYLKGERCSSEKCALTRRQTLPGVHSSTRKRTTSYGTQFREKQKVKRTYGLLEKQFRRFFEMASKSKGNTGVRFLQLLELRLDNVVYKLGITNSREHARQLITHGHVTVDGAKISVPSYVVKVGEVVSVKESSSAKEFMTVLAEKNKSANIPEWLEKGKKLEGRVAQEPSREMIDEGINEQLIVEFYSR